MKKTLSLLLAAVTALTMTAANFMAAPQQIANVGAPVKMEMKKAPAALQAKMAAKFAAKLKASPNFPASTADDLVGGYEWTYRQYTGGLTTQPDTLDANSRDQEDNINVVGINKVSDTSIRLTGFMPNPVTATMGATSGYTTFTVDAGQVVYTHSTYGTCTLAGAWYYEGDDTNEAGWYNADIMGVLVDEGIVLDPEVHFFLVIQSGTYANYRLGWIYEPGSAMVPDTDYNAMMSYTYNSLTFDYPVKVSEDENYVVTVAENFGGVSDNPVTLTLAADKTWAAAEAQVLYTSGDNTFALYGTDGSQIYSLTGTGTETVLTFDSDWTGYDNNTGYWLGQRGAATITRIDDGVFVYPSETVPEALYLIGSYNDWSQQTMLPLVKGEDGKWTITQEMAAGAQFKLLDEAGNWFGGEDANSVGYFEVLEGMVNDATPIALVDGANFMIPVAGTWTLTVDKENKTMVVSGEWVTPAPEKDHVYILGEVNGNTWSAKTGEEMDTEDHITFTKDVTCSANNDGYSYFSFTTKLAGENEDWNDIAGFRMGAQSNDYEVTDELMGTELTVIAGQNAFKVADGEYTLTLNLENMKLVVAKKAAPGLAGDVTGNGVVDIDDVNAVIKIILNKASQDDYPGNANVNGEGDVDVDDVNAIIKIMLGKA